MVNNIRNGLIQDPINSEDLELDISGKSFSGRVWKWLQTNILTPVYNFFCSIHDFFLIKPKIIEQKVTLNKPQQKSFIDFKNKVLIELPDHIGKQRVVPTYKRDRFEFVTDTTRNYPFEIPKEAPEGITFTSKNIIFYPYSADGVQDYGWGCTWRCIQSCLTSYGINVEFEELFHMFGRKENLKTLYDDKFQKNTRSFSKQFAPYEHGNGWADPFTAQMAFHFYDIDSSLETINGLPGGCCSPREFFPTETLNFSKFKAKLINHFKMENPAPVMIDNGICTLNIIGIGIEGDFLKLWIADPHLEYDANNKIGSSTAGLYTVLLDKEGRREHSSLDDEDMPQLQILFTEKSYGDFQFFDKRWAALFPGKLI